MTSAYDSEGHEQCLAEIPWQMLLDVVGNVCCCRCAEAFISAGHHAKAVQLLVRARQPERALDLLLNHDVPLTDELAEALTPEKKPDNADSRSAVLMRIAQVRKEMHSCNGVAVFLLCQSRLHCCIAGSHVYWQDCIQQ